MRVNGTGVRSRLQSKLLSTTGRWSTEELINPFLGWYHAGDDEFDNCNSCITAILHVMYNTAVIPILRETEL